MIKAFAFAIIFVGSTVLAETRVVCKSSIRSYASSNDALSDAQDRINNTISLESPLNSVSAPSVTVYPQGTNFGAAICVTIEK